MMKEEYLKTVSEFRETMLSKGEELTEKDFEDWLTWQVLATCHTEGCRVQGMTFKETISEPLDGVYRMVCGMCCNTIEDIDPMFEDDDDFRMNVRHEDGSFGVWKAV